MMKKLKQWFGVKMKKLFYAELEPWACITAEAESKIEFIKKIKKEIQSNEKIVFITEL